jgi:hypothetical protein
MVTSTRFKLMTSADYRNEGLLPLLSLVTADESIKDCSYRVYAIGLQQAYGRPVYEFVISCDSFTRCDVPFAKMPSVLL